MTNMQRTSEDDLTVKSESSMEGEEGLKEPDVRMVQVEWPHQVPRIWSFDNNCFVVFILKKNIFDKHYYDILVPGYEMSQAAIAPESHINA